MIRFYATLIFSYFSDMALSLLIIWTTLSVTGSPFILGTVMSISIVIPFLIRKFIPKLDLLKMSLKQLYICRIALYSLILVIAMIGIMNFISLTILSGLIAIINLCTLSSYESTNAQLVILEKITANKSARIMQTVIQIGAFSGASIGGFLLKNSTPVNILLLISCLDLIACFVFLIILNPLFKELSLDVVENESLECQIENIEQNNIKNLLILCIILGVIGFHIATFNIVGPVIFQEIKEWDVSIFGLASGIAGIGAFSAVFFNLNRIFFLFPFFLIISDFIFGFSNSTYLTIFICFFIGFSVNSIRICIRELMIKNSKNKNEAKIMGEKSAVFYSISQAIAPIFVGSIISLLQNEFLTQSLLMIVAISIFILILYSKKQLNLQITEGANNI